MTLSASAVSKKRLDKIDSNRPEVKDSASIDLEWIQYEGRYEHTKTKIFAASFCTNWGDRIVLYISRYSDRPNPEKALIQDILFYLNQFPLTFGWYTTGIAVYDDRGFNRVRCGVILTFLFASEVYVISSTITYRSKKDIWPIGRFQ